MKYASSARTEDAGQKNQDCRALQAEDNRYGVYIVPAKDATWSAVISAKQENMDAIRLCDEKTYPVEVFYRRYDVNGSSMLDTFVCVDRASLLDYLNWAGACRFPVTSFWDYRGESCADTRLWELFETGYRKRAEIAQEEMAEMRNAEKSNYE